MEPVEIPSHVDDPPHVLLWSADELAPVAIGLVMGVLTGNAFILTALGLVIAKLYRRFRDNHPDGFFLHVLYWFGLWPTKTRTMPNPYIRRFLP